MAFICRPCGILLVTLSIFIPAANAGDEPRPAALNTTGPTVEVLGPVRVRVADPVKLLEICQPGSKAVLACTRFIGAKLECACQREGATFHVTAAARIVPVMYLANYDTAEFHERMHIHDVAERLRAYLVWLTGRQFGTEEECLVQASAASSPGSLRHHLHDYQVQSNSWLQCSKEGERITPAEAADRESFETIAVQAARK